MMRKRPSEAAFEKGLDALRDRRAMEALESFKAALELEPQGQPTNLRTKYSSFLGLALTLAYGATDESERLCENAARRGFVDPDLFCNLGIVYLRRRRKKEAFQAFAEALKLAPSHERTLTELSRFDRRRKPVLPFLPRQHALNTALGRIRHRISPRVAPEPEDLP